MKRLLALVLVSLLGTAAVATAHGGALVAEGKNGGYSIRVLASSDVDGVDLTVYLVRQDLGEPDSSAEVDIEVTDPAGKKRSVTAESLADGYEAVFAGERGAWRDWKIDVAVTGKAGNAELAIASTGRGDQRGLAATTMVLLGFLVVMCGAASVLVVRRRVSRLEAKDGELPNVEH